MNKILILVVTSSLLAGCNFVSVNSNNYNQVGCTEEAKLCPDGSAVARTGPNCEFAPCPDLNSIMIETQARAIAEATCIKGGEALGPGIYNQGTQTWWFEANLNATKEGCNPACVVSEATQTAEINWRCTGLIIPEDDQGTVSGQVLLGPTCPVIKNPPDPACADKPYKTTVQVILANSPSSQTYATAQSNDQGFYEISLPPGNYALQPVGGSMLPRCQTTEITVKANQQQTINLSCDTGIR